MDRKLAKLIQSNRKIFTTADLGLIWDVKKQATLHQTISRYVKANLLYPLKRGVYSIVALDQLNKDQLVQMNIPYYSYITGPTVLFREGIISQPTSTDVILAAERGTTGQIDLAGEIGQLNLPGQSTKKLSYLARKMHPQYLFNDTGVIDKDGVRVATLERAVADTLYYNPKAYFDGHEQIDWEGVSKIRREVYENV